MTVTEVEVKHTCDAVVCNYPSHEFVPGQDDGHWLFCAVCFHTSVVHGYGPDDQAGLRKRKYGAEKLDPTKPTKVVYKSVSSAPVASGEVSTDYTPAQLREALRKAGEQVGQRGRLSPEQKKKAISILNGGK